MLKFKDCALNRGLNLIYITGFKNNIFCAGFLSLSLKHLCYLIVLNRTDNACTGLYYPCLVLSDTLKIRSEECLMIHIYMGKNRYECTVYHISCIHQSTHAAFKKDDIHLLIKEGQKA